MTRLPFNPKFMAGSDPVEPKASRDSPMTVRKVADLIRDALATAVPTRIRVVGEVSNFSGRSHWFFSLKDDRATIRCVCFASVAKKVDLPIADGLEVVATGRLDFYETQGHVQLYVDKIELVGQGALELRFRALCEELRAAGYFDPQTKRLLPSVAPRIAVVTSRSAAALQDVIDTSRQRWSGCELFLFDVRVQGPQAAPQIAAALRSLSKHGRRLGIDAIILTRGGGTIEDLWAFNEQAVADAIYDCTLPIVAAIGHETDTTIAELVADVRCATPTQAAMALVADAQVLQQQADHYADRLTILLRHQAEYAQQRFEAVVRHPLFRTPQALVETARDTLNRGADLMSLALRDRLVEARQRLTDCRHGLTTTGPRGRLRLEGNRLTEYRRRLAGAVQRTHQDRMGRLDGLGRQLDAVGPKSVLGRGYTYTMGDNGKVLRNMSQVEAGQRITTIFVDGRVRSRVVDSQLGDASDTSRVNPQPRRRTGPTRSDDREDNQMDLFGTNAK